MRSTCLQGLAYVDFSDEKHLKAAVAKNKQKLLGQKLSIARSDPARGKKRTTSGKGPGQPGEQFVINVTPLCTWTWSRPIYSIILRSCGFPYMLTVLVWCHLYSCHICKYFKIFSSMHCYHLLWSASEVWVHFSICTSLYVSIIVWIQFLLGYRWVFPVLHSQQSIFTLLLMKIRFTVVSLNEFYRNICALTHFIIIYWQYFL